MASRYWVVSLPVKDSASSLWNRLQDQISRHSFDTPLYRFNIPNLRVGTLDSLLSLSDDLLKSNSFLEAVSHKIRRQIEDLERISGTESNALTVDGVPVDSYLTRFVWDEAKYPTMSPLKEIVDGIHGSVVKIEDDLKVRVAEYNNVRSQLNVINRKQSGSLAVRDLSNLVKPEDIVSSEHLETLLAIVPKYSQKDWLASYETLTNYVVPRSSKKLFEDNEYALYTVTLFRRVADNFRTSSREKGFQVRDFEYSSEAQEDRKQEMDKLVQDQESLRSSLLQWCYTSYGESCVLAPGPKSEKKVRSILEGLCDAANSTFWKLEEEAGAGMAALGGDGDGHASIRSSCFHGGGILSRSVKDIGNFEGSDRDKSVTVIVMTPSANETRDRPQQEETGGFDGGGRTKSSKRRPEELIQMLDEFGSSYPSFAERCDHLNSASSHESNSMSTPPPDQNGSSEDFALAASCSHHHVDGDLNVKQGVSFDESRGIVPWFLILFSL
ncbi:V-type proton ATPase subunit C [Linum grandiflorum]